MNLIEKQIHEHFANQTELAGHALATQNLTTSNGTSRPRDAQSLSPPFAKVNSVVPDSPADSAGLKPGDEIRTFGYVNSSNHDGLRRVAEVVQGNEGVCISLLLPLYMLIYGAARSGCQSHPACSSRSRQGGAKANINATSGLGRPGSARLPCTAYLTREGD
jgi:hypothetical protein